MKKIFGFGMIFLFCLGCDSFRFAPTQEQKENAWLHNRTALLAAQTAKEQNCSEELKSLTGLCELQSQAFAAYFGLPQEFPPSQTVGQVLAQSNYELAQTATVQSAQRPDAFDLADGVLELGIGISALLGGVYGTRAVRFFTAAKEKSQALREIIRGNELFKKQNEESSEEFKKAQEGQSAQTRKIVAEMKNG